MAPRLAAPSLETASLRLRELALADAEATHEIYSDPETMKYWSSKPVSSAKVCSGSAGGYTDSGRTASCWGC